MAVCRVCGEEFESFAIHLMHREECREGVTDVVTWNESVSGENLNRGPTDMEVTHE
jgi:hypothetical protein